MTQLGSIFPLKSHYFRFSAKISSLFPTSLCEEAGEQVLVGKRIFRLTNPLALLFLRYGSTETKQPSCLNNGISAVVSGQSGYGDCADYGFQYTFACRLYVRSSQAMILILHVKR
ncbi:hypothetical protein D3C73_1253460 [compost metagenome]